MEALREIPAVNAEVRGTDIVYRDAYHIGIAIGATRGLVVPVLRGADRLSFAEIEQAIDDFAAGAESNKLEPGELSGGTFTISNGGIYGSLLSTPIVNAHSKRRVGNARDPTTSRGTRGAGRHPAHDVCGTDVRSSPHRRPRSGDISQANQRNDRIAGAAVRWSLRKRCRLGQKTCAGHQGRSAQILMAVKYLDRLPCRAWRRAVAPRVTARFECFQLAFRFILSDAVSLLNGAGQLVAATLNAIHFIVGELAPLFFDFSLQFFPIAFGCIPVHCRLQSKSRLACAAFFATFIVQD